uniref:PLAC8-like protein 1 n=1 Tax=Chelydra serpentina TaxID=8475 RepID=A0A8C3SKU6_CHESE
PSPRSARGTDLARRETSCPGSICDDWLVMACCGPCGLCQLSRELSHRK